MTRRPRLLWLRLKYVWKRWQCACLVAELERLENLPAGTLRTLEGLDRYLAWQATRRRWQAAQSAAA
ncbi:hypothetical protein IAI58_15510 [Roseomonas marmotae]|uniref:hypothetical protein n=1 Tax=Roseomonas marmotae TaxID=2768161 RepID=UPI001AD74781|nr:hypothetical protein [Roseomonas marmotae]QTI79021.1 hypothetical protein IAI58_15510 [Roseomonas marmotae]